MVGVNGNAPPLAVMALQMTLPEELVVSALAPLHDAVPVIAKVEVVAFVNRELPKSVVEPNRFANVELNAPLTVVEPNTAKLVEVAPWNDDPPLAVKVPSIVAAALAFSAPPMLSNCSVLEPETDSAVVVAPVNVAPPLNAS